MKLLNMSIATGLVFFIIILSNILNYKTAECEEVDDKYSNLEVVDVLNVVDLADKEIERLQLEKIEKDLEEIRLQAKENDKFNGRKYRIEKLIVTAYAPFDNKSGMCNDGNPNTTSTGLRPNWGTVAVNPKRFPYGTEFYIEGYPYKAVALDTGGAMRKNSNKIDLYMDTYEQAISWGKREIDVIVFEDTN